MAFVAAKCTQCGASIQVDETKEAGICQYCGTAFVTEKAINNYNITNNIQIESATFNVAGVNIDNLLLRAQQYEENGDYATAKEYYNRILDIDANHEIAKKKVFSLDKLYIGNVVASQQDIATIEAYIRRGTKLDAIKKAREISGLGLAEAKYYVDNFDTIDKTKPQQLGYQTGPANTTSSRRGCYVATCVYGSYDCPQVWTLRRFRDDTLATTWYGRMFIRSYYAISPSLVKWFGHTEWFKKLWKNKLDKLINKLQVKGFASTPYEDINW